VRVEGMSAIVASRIAISAISGSRAVSRESIARCGLCLNHASAFYRQDGYLIFRCCAISIMNLRYQRILPLTPIVFALSTPPAHAVNTTPKSPKLASGACSNI
jgi:hypothetical protein